MVSGVTPYRPLGFDKGVSRESYAGSVLNVQEGGHIASTRVSMMDDFKDDHFAIVDSLTAVWSGDKQNVYGDKRDSIEAHR